MLTYIKALFDVGKHHCFAEIGCSGTPTPVWYSAKNTNFDQILGNNWELPLK